VHGSALAAAPTGRFTVSGDEATVRDNRTRLVWQRTLSTETRTWSDASNYCQGLNTQNFGGYSSGWRLPTRKELISIVDIRAYLPSIDATAFPGTPSANFWSSSVYASGSNAWFVFFNDGHIGNSAQSNKYYVRCVR